MNEYYAYALIDPRTDKPFYIGKGKGDRYKAHLVPSKLKEKSIKNNMIKKLVRLGLNHTVVISNLMSEEDALEVEMLLIAEYGRVDNGSGILSNHTDGGDGASGYKHTEEHKSFISTIHKERVFSEEHKEAMRKPKSEEGRKAIAEAQRKLRADGYRPSKESNVKRSNTLKGRVMSSEHAQKISEAQKGKPKEQATCIHCGKTSVKGLIVRWHNDNCKELKNAG